MASVDRFLGQRGPEGKLFYRPAEAGEAVADVLLLVEEGSQMNHLSRLGSSLELLVFKK